MISMERILVVDDDRIVLMGLEGVLKHAGFEVSVASSACEAIESLESQSYDLVLTDLVLQDDDGISILKKTKEVSPETAVVVITGFASVNSAIEALRQGAFDYLIKPCEDEELLIRVRRGLERKRMLKEIREKEIQDERLKAIAQTAVTVNDQINTPLNVIQASTEYLRETVTETDPALQESLSYIESEVSKIKEVVSNLARIVDPQVKGYAVGEITMVDLDRSTIQRKQEQSAKRHSSTPVILVVDDEEYMLHSLSKLLTLMGFKTETADSGQTALEIFNSRSIDLIITDVNMPGMSGMELLKQIKGKNPDIPVIIITGFGVEKAQAIARENNADGFLPKPFKMNDIRSLIDKLLTNCIPDYQPKELSAQRSQK
jgi:DNA-binding NtrC family response regulator